MLENFNRNGLRCAVIGASGGIGGAFIRHLSASALVATVFALSRREPNNLPDGVQWLSVDLTDEATIEQAAGEIGATVDILIIATGILHAGDLQPEKDWRHLNGDHLARVLEINTIGPALAIKHFAPLMPREGKSLIAALSARVGSISDNRLGGWYAYRASKAALNQIIRTTAIELKRKKPGAMIIGLHPGTVETDLSAPFQGSFKERFTPDRSAQHLLDVISSLPADASGKVYDWKGDEIPA